MLVAPGFHAIVFKLAEHFVGQGLVTRGTGLVAAAGKISEKGGLKKREMNEAKGDSDCLGGLGVGGYLRKERSKVVLRDFRVENRLHSLPVHEGDDVVLMRKRVFETERFGQTVRSLPGLNQVADQGA